MQQDTAAGQRSPIRIRLGAVDQKWFFGVISTCIGLSQLPVAYMLLPEHSPLAFVVGSGAWFLISIGINLLRDRAPFESDWHEDGAHGWFSLTVIALTTIAIVVSSVIGVLSW